MPTYDYQCDACQHKFEHFQSINDPLLTKCPECGKKKLRRLFGTGGAIVFKGSGFYQTDYRSESYKKGAKAESKSSDGKSSEGKAGEGGKSDSAKSESKPESAKPKPEKKSGGEKS